jgi:flagellar basal-body rod protein FlgG
VTQAACCRVCACVHRLPFVGMLAVVMLSAERAGANELAREDQEILTVAAQLKLEKLAMHARNLACVAMPGFKRSDLVLVGSPSSASTGTVRLDFSQGRIEETGRELDVAIDGPGFFELGDIDGNTFFTRAGNFFIDRQGLLSIGSPEDERWLEPRISIANDATEIRITRRGIVKGKQPGNFMRTQFGQIPINRFVGADELIEVAPGIFKSVGTPMQSSPGEAGAGVLLQRRLEQSNVDRAAERRMYRKTLKQYKKLTQILAKQERHP